MRDGTAPGGDSIPDGITMRSDVAIVGAGAAGITIARELRGSRLDVLLIESGGPQVEDRYQDLCRGETFGTPYWPLDGNRQRCLGGTTNLWAGWSRPLDEVDLEPRDWVSASGWVLSRAELIPYYRRAHEVCQLQDFDYGLETWEERLRAHRLPLEGSGVESRIFQLSPPTRFGPTYMADLMRAPNVKVIDRATVLELEVTSRGDAVSALRIGTLTGRRFRIEADSFVLAGGALENARLLLLSGGERSDGLGNDHGQVGRYFMEHLHFTAGSALLRNVESDVEHLYSPHGKRTAVARLFPTSRVQREHGILQGNVMLMPATRPETPPGRRVARRVLDRLRGGVTVRLAHTIEQPPDPDNRVTLSSERDPFGLPRVRLEWRVGELERKTFLVNHRAIAAAVERAGLGTVDRVGPATQWPPAELQGMRGHHMGTTRMSAKPAGGVVDVDCRVHGVRNLFVAGSSVFPTGGAGTPTLTIVALALRLADHLLGRPTS